MALVSQTYHLHATGWGRLTAVTTQHLYVVLNLILFVCYSGHGDDGDDDDHVDGSVLHYTTTLATAIIVFGEDVSFRTKFPLTCTQFV